jgi:hypothetical protein
MNSCIDWCFSEHWQTSSLILLVGFIASNVYYRCIFLLYLGKTVFTVLVILEKIHCCLDSFDVTVLYLLYLISSVIWHEWIRFPGTVAN